MEKGEEVSHQKRVVRREILVLVDADQYCHISHSVDVAHRALAIRRTSAGRRWLAGAIVEAVEATFSQASEHARKWRAIAAMNGYEEVNNPHVLRNVINTPLMRAVAAQAHWWPFKVTSLFPVRKMTPREQMFHKRDRHIYVIADKFMRCYVGQSVSPRQRVWAHLSCNAGEPTASWLKEINFDVQHLVVDMVHGTYWDAVRAEFKWRAIAEFNGFQNVDITRPLQTDESTMEAARASAESWPFVSWKSSVFTSHLKLC